MRLFLLFGIFNPRNATTYVSAHFYRFLHECRCLWLTDQSILRESHNLQIYLVRIFFLGLQHCCDTFQSPFAIYIRKCSDMSHAVFYGKIASLADIFNNPAPIILCFEIRSAFDGIQRIAHTILLIFF